MNIPVNDIPALIINAFAEQIAQAALSKLNDQLYATIQQQVEAAIQKHLSVPKEYIQEIAREEIQNNFEGPGFKETIDKCFDEALEKCQLYDGKDFDEAVESVIDNYDLSSTVENAIENMNFSVSVRKY